MADNGSSVSCGTRISELGCGKYSTRDEKSAGQELAQASEACSTLGDWREADHVSKIERAPSTSNDENAQLNPHSSYFSYEKWITETFRDSTKCRKREGGVAYRNLNVHGFGTSTDYQKTFANYPLTYLNLLATLFGHQSKSRIDILRDFEGVVNSGEMLLVLGRPGSGCTTFLKAIAGDAHGFFIDKKSMINYQGKKQAYLIRSYCVIV
jgi:ATPase subunit of ABC transporter with duplicated ATPase domains